MSEELPRVLRRDSAAVRAARPLVDDARVIKERVIEDLQEIDDELKALHDRGQEVIDDAEDQAEKIREEAREEGRKEGMRDCLEALAKARAEYSRLCNRAERDMVTLAFQIAQRIIGHAIEVQPEVVRDIVGEALIAARGRSQIAVRLHPDDHQWVESHRHEYARDVDGVTVYFETDASLERGDCVIETESGRIDARLETQLEVLRTALLSGADPTQGLTSEESL